MLRQVPAKQSLASLETPALLLDLDAVRRNVHRMAEFFVDRPCRLRPHVKTHKLPTIARMQIEAGAIGVTCATLREVEVMQQAGIRSILIANQIVTPGGIQQLVRLCAQGEVMICIDDLDNAQKINAVARAQRIVVPFLIEVNVGLNRCGVAPGASALELLRAINELPGLHFRGLMGYEGGLFLENAEEKDQRCRAAHALLIQTRDLLATAGYCVEIVSAGGSNTYRNTGLLEGISEIQPGSYVTMDEHNRRYGIDFEQALTVLATVISRPAPDRAVIDAGKKAISCDEGLPLCCRAGVELFGLNEEHGHIRFDPSAAVHPGDKLELVPSHGCTTIPFYDRYNIRRGEQIVGCEPILARR